jgi:hypothetical protein
MTDKEMVLALGNYINSLLAKRAALEGAFLNYRIPNEEGRQVELPWKEDVKRIEQEESFRRLSGAQSDSLLQAIGDETQPSDLIRALCKHYLQ